MHPSPYSHRLRRPPKEELCQFADELLLSVCYNTNFTKTHIAKYLIHFVAKCILKAAYRFQKQCDQQCLIKNKANVIRGHLRCVKGYNTTLKMVNSILFQVQRVVSVGNLLIQSRQLRRKISELSSKIKSSSTRTTRTTALFRKPWRFSSRKTS